MKTYELFLLLNPDLDQTRVDQELKGFEEIFAKHGGKIVDIDNRGRKKSAYPIKNKRDANQVILKVELEPNQVTQVKKQLSITNNILRYSLLNVNQASV